MNLRDLIAEGYELLGEGSKENKISKDKYLAKKRHAEFGLSARIDKVLGRMPPSPGRDTLVAYNKAFGRKSAQPYAGT